MKRILIVGAFALAVGGPALAADLPPPMAPPPRAPATYVPAPVPYYNWTGFYIGGNFGAGYNQGSFCGAGGCFGTQNSAKFLGGGQVGANYEFGNGVLVGVEAMFDWTPNTGNTAVLTDTTTGNSAALTINNSWLTTVTGRLGYAWDRVLLYGKGGFAWVGASNSHLTDLTTGQSINGSGSNYGWTAGAGVEWAFWGNWSARVEYDYIGLNGATYAVPTSFAAFPGDTFTGSNRNIQMVTLGINYKFGW